MERGGIFQGEPADILRRGYLSKIGEKIPLVMSMNFLMANGIVISLQKMSATGEAGTTPPFASREVAKGGELFNQQGNAQI